MEIGIDAIAVALMFCWAGVVFLLAILFKKEHRRLKDNLEELKKTKISKYRRKCFSIEWERDQSRLKVIAARGIFIMIPMFVAGTIALISLWIFSTLGYAMFIPVIGFPIFLDNVFEMYRYSKAVRKEPLENLQSKDQEYMEVTMEVLATRSKIYSIVGVMFLTLAPFIPQLFNLLPSFVATYFRPAFLLVEKLGLALGLFVALIIFIALPTTLGVKYKWTIRQIKRPIEWIRSKRRTRERKKTSQ